MANIPNIPNIPEVPDGNIPPAVPNGEPKIPDIPAASMSSDNSMKTEEDDGAKWLLLTGDFQKNGAIVSWLDKQDLEKFSTNLETCTLFSLEQRIRNLHPGDNNTYIAILPPDKSEFIYLYKNRRCDLYYYTYDYVYILKDVDEDDWREYAVNYFTNSQLPDFSDSEFIALDKIIEIQQRWNDKLPQEFIDKVLRCVYLFYSPEETEFKIFRFLDKMLQKKDDGNLDRIERQIEKRLKALLKEDLTLSKAQQEILDDIASEMVNILSNTSHQEEKQTFPEIHERWDDKLPKEFIDKVLSNVNLFCSPEETEFKVFRYLDKMQNKDEIDLEGIDRIIKKRLNSLLAENIELSSSQQVALDDIANDMVNLVIGFSKKKNNPQPEQTRVIDKEEKSDTGRNDNIETVTPPRKERDVNKLDTTYNIKTNRYKRIGIGIICIFVIYILFSWVFSKDNSENDNPNEELISVADPSIRIDPSRDVEEQLSEYYSLVSDAGDGFFIIMQIDNDDDENIKYGLASVSGVVVCKPMFDYIYSIGNGFFVVEKDGQKGCISTDGKLVVKPEYDLVYDMVDDTFDKETGLIKVKKNDKQGLVNIHTSKEVAPCIYSDIGSLEGGLYKVSIDGKVGYLNKDGSVFKQPE